MGWRLYVFRGYCDVLKKPHLNLLSVRLVLIVVFSLCLSQVISIFVKSYFTRMEFERIMLAEAVDQYALQIRALSKQTNASLPIVTSRPLTGPDRIWRSNSPVVPDNQSQQDVEAEVLSALLEYGIVPNTIMANFIDSSHLTGLIDPTSGTSPQVPPPMEANISGRFEGLDGWINAQLRSGPPPHPVSIRDIFLSIVIVLSISVFGILVIMKEVREALFSLRTAAGLIGSSNPPSPLSLSGPREFHSLISDLNRTERRVNELITEKDVMLGALGHDLRTPLTSLRLRLEEMEPIEDRNKAIETVDTLSALLEDILELARSGQKSNSGRLYDIGTIIEDVVSDAQERGESVTIENRQRIVARCNPDSIRRMLQNLIDNATRYAGSAHVVISRKSNAIQIEVYDEGPGLPKEALSEISQPFQSYEVSTASPKRGSGLGLTLVKAIARAHDGDIKIRNRSPRGLSVVVTIPTAPTTIQN